VREDNNDDANKTAVKYKGVTRANMHK
jgi:hypothetical protein